MPTIIPLEEIRVLGQSGGWIPRGQIHREMPNILTGQPTRKLTREKKLRHRQKTVGGQAMV